MSSRFVSHRLPGLLALLIAVAGAPARASEIPLGPVTGWYGLVGPVIGGAFPGTRDYKGKQYPVGGFVLGLEGSLVHIENTERWAGVYAEVAAIPVHPASQTSGTHGFRLSVGPEAGMSVVGLDGGYVLEAYNGRLHHGLQVRGLLTIGVAAVWVRWVQLLGVSGSHAEMGVLLKVPIEFGGKRSDSQGER